MSRESAPVRVLLVSRDLSTIEFLCQHTQLLSMHVETSCDVASAMRKLCHDKFEGVMIDFELGNEALYLLGSLRGLTCNHRAIASAVVDTEVDAKAAQAQSNFVLRRPFAVPDVVRTLRASYPLMFRERRRDYRYPIEVRTFIKEGSNSEFSGVSTNISETGIAIKSPAPLTVGTTVQLCLDLPGMPERLKVCSEVCWTNPDGRTGLRFSDLCGSTAERLQLWLTERMSESVPEW